MTHGSSLSAVTLRALALLVAGSSIGLAANALRRDGVDLRGSAGVAACEGPAYEPIVLPTSEAAQLCARPHALIADARSTAEYAAGHAAGAIHLPCDTSGHTASAALDHLADRSLVLVYGSSTDEAVAVARGIARQLPAAGGPTIYALEGGFAAWERAGLACASGPCDGCGAAPMTSPSSTPATPPVPR